jgi:hypothetical protein
MADRLYKHVCDLTTHQAMVVIAANRNEMSTDFMRFVWDVVYEKVKARDKGAV